MLLNISNPFQTAVEDYFVQLDAAAQASSVKALRIFAGASIDELRSLGRKIDRQRAMLRDLENDKLIKQISALHDSMLWLERRHVERGEPEAAQMLRPMNEWNEERRARLGDWGRKTGRGPWREKGG